MPKQNQPAAKPAPKAQQKPTPVPVAEMSNDVALADGAMVEQKLTSGLSLQGQAVRLGDPRLRTIQRQIIAGQIGRVQGNHHLQHVISHMKQPQTRVPYQPNILAKTEAEVVNDAATTEPTRSLAISGNKGVYSNSENAEAPIIKSQSDLVQRGILDDVWSGMKGLGASVLGKLSVLGADAIDLLTRMGAAAHVWIPKILAFLSNPVAFMTGRFWLSLPNQIKPMLIRTLLQHEAAILNHMRGLWNIALGPLWPLARSFMLGFIERMLQVKDLEKITLSNRLAIIMSGGSMNFVWGIVKGLGLGLWDVIKMPYDLIVGIIDGIKFVSRVIGQLGFETLRLGAEVMLNALPAAWNGIQQMILNPRLILDFIRTIWNSIGQAITQVGAGIAEALIQFVRLPDQEMGEKIGRFASQVAVDILLAVFTSGAGGLIRRAAGLLAEFMSWFRKGGRVLAQMMRMMRLAIEPLLLGLQRLGQLFRKSRFGEWIDNFGAWLDKLFLAIDAAVAAHLLTHLGESEPETGQEHITEEGIELNVEGWAIDIFPPSSSQKGLIQRDLPAGESGEQSVIRALRSNRIEGLPQMDYIIRGQFNTSGHGQDLFAFRVVGEGTRAQLHLYRIEVKGGQYPKLGRTRFGPQTGRGWTRYAIDGALNNPRLLALLRDRTGITDIAKLRSRLILGRSYIIVSKTIKLSALRKLERNLKRIPHRHRPRIRYR